MTNDLKSALDREFDACTPDIRVDTEALVARGRSRVRTRYAGFGAAALALVMAAGVVIGNVPRGGGPGADPAESVSVSADPARDYAWATVASLPDDDVSRALSSALEAGYRAAGAPPQPATGPAPWRVSAHQEALTSRSHASPGTGPRTEEPRRNAYQALGLSEREGVPDDFRFTALPHGTWNTAPDLPGLDLTVRWVELGSFCERYDEEIGRYLAESGVKATCEVTDPAGPGRSTVITITFANEQGGHVGSYTSAVRFLANGDVYVLSETFQSAPDSGGAGTVIGPPLYDGGQLAAILDGLPEVDVP